MLNWYRFSGRDPLTLMQTRKKNGKTSGNIAKKSLKPFKVNKRITFCEPIATQHHDSKLPVMLDCLIAWLNQITQERETKFAKQRLRRCVPHIFSNYRKDIVPGRFFSRFRASAIVERTGIPEGRNNNCAFQVFERCIAQSQHTAAQWEVHPNPRDVTSQSSHPEILFSWILYRYYGVWTNFGLLRKHKNSMYDLPGF